MCIHTLPSDYIPSKIRHGIVVASSFRKLYKATSLEEEMGGIENWMMSMRNSCSQNITFTKALTYIMWYKNVHLLSRDNHTMHVGTPEETLVAMHAIMLTNYRVSQTTLLHQHNYAIDI